MAYDLNSLQQQLYNLQRQLPQITSQTPIQPMTNLMPSPPVIPKQVQYVDGVAGAKLYQSNLSPNSSEIILDKEKDVLYMVSKDANGTPARKITAARFTIIDIDDDEPAFLTRKDLDSFKEEIRQLFVENKGEIKT